MKHLFILFTLSLTLGTATAGEVSFCSGSDCAAWWSDKSGNDCSNWGLCTE